MEGRLHVEAPKSGGGSATSIQVLDVDLVSCLQIFNKNYENI
jgi:hypothetical protein